MAGHERMLEAENKSLKARIQELEAELAQYRSQEVGAPTTSAPPPAPQEAPTTLDPEEYKRYGRQMILPEIALQGQLRLKSTKLLIVGVGGLGCPAAAYLAGAGIGTLGLIDHDTVETSNLHRQILHRTSTVSTPKVHSAITTLHDLNPHVTYTAHAEALTSQNALTTLSAYDIILDCTDHPSLRYLVSDACVLLGKPLVSASALRADGQLIVLNSPPGRGPCYRCIWPRPPPAESVASCGEAGVLGPVVGVMGVLQALEAIRLIASPLSPDHDAKESRMLFFSAYAPTPWRTLRMRGKRPLCVACGAPEDLRDKISAAALTEGVFDYVGFCGSGGEGRVQLAEEHRMTVPEVKSEVVPPLVVDVRDRTQFGICSVPGSVNVPFSEFQSTAGLVDGNGCSVLPEDMARLLRNMEKERAVVVVCRLGNDSQEAARQVMESGVFKGRVYDVRGGIREWAKVAPQDGVVEY